MSCYPSRNISRATNLTLCNPGWIGLVNVSPLEHYKLMIYISFQTFIIEWT